MLTAGSIETLSKGAFVPCPVIVQIISIEGRTVRRQK